MTPLAKYVWLINLLQEKDGMTFEEINERWLKYRRGTEDENIPILKRTFHNHIKAIKEEYGIHIECGPGYRYYIHDSTEGVNSIVGRLSALNVLSDTVSDRKLSESLYADEFFDFFRDDSVMTIMDAIKRRRKVRFSHFRYLNHPEKNKYIVLHVAPYQLHYICSKWYLIGETDEFGLMRIPLGYNRSKVRLTDVSYNYPVNYSSEEYSKLIYGATKDNRIHLSIKITSPVSKKEFEEDYFEKYPIMPFQQGVEYKLLQVAPVQLKFFYSSKDYIIVHLDLPKTPFAFYVLKNRIRSYNHSMIDDQVPFSLFTDEQYNDDVEKPVVL